MIRCARCHRELRRQPVMVAGMALGPSCAQAVVGAKPPRIKRESRKSDDERQLVFEWVRFAGTTYGVSA